VSNLKQT